MRHFMVDPDNEERLLKIPPRVVQEIRADALDAAREAVEDLGATSDSFNYPQYWRAVLDSISKIDALRGDK